MTTTKPHLLELDLYPPMIEFFQNQNYSIELEMPIYRNRIDLIAFNFNHLIAVELKLKDWKRALRQAAYYQLGVDYSYIAMPFYQAIAIYRWKHLLVHEGVGLYGVLLDNSEVRELVKPKKSEKKVDYIERGIFSIVRRRW